MSDDARSDERAPNGRPGVLFGLAFVAMGIFIMFMVQQPRPGEAPTWLGMIIGAVFGLAGLSVIFQALGRPELGKWLALPVVFGLTAPGFWIMLDAEDKSCTASIGPSTFLSGDFMCRAVFGAGAVVTLIAALGITFSLISGALRRRRQDADNS